MNLDLTRLLRLLLGLALPLSLSFSAWAQLPPDDKPPFEPGIASVATPAFENCRPTTDKAMAVDLKAATAQSQKRDLSEQLRLYEEVVALWSQAVAQCDGRARERAQRNLADSQKVRGSLSEQQGAGPQCEAAHKDAAAFQEMARQAFSERRFGEAALLFRKTENMWDTASERCAGTQQEVANRRREQSEMDSHNAEHCAPVFEKAREEHQKLRASAAGLSREEKQETSQGIETLWREAMEQCRGAVLDTVRNNIQAIARERGTPWVARSAPNAAMALAPTASQLVAAPAGQKPQPVNLAAPVAAAAVTSEKQGMPTAQPPEFTSGDTRFSGNFVREADGLSYSGTGKMVWTHGDLYEGPLVKGLRHGKGLFVWASGQRYNGDWVNDKQVGQASMKFVGGNQYEGGIDNGQPHGQGRMRYASGDTYTGTFNAGVLEGQGLYIWKNGQQQEGEWKTQQLNGQPDGQGRYHWSNGDEYVGQWRAGKKHGQGTFIWRSGDRWEGIYEDGEQTAEGKLTQKN
ncbi:MAG: repeat-containing protein [Polaromonas sp.]|nr:repeat-containing protein [Polaromonas sp.]